eukprot:2486877-Rhodomonas_salina.1
MQHKQAHFQNNFQNSLYQENNFQNTLYQACGFVHLILPCARGATRSVWCAVSGALLCNYAVAMRCPVLSRAMLLPIALRICHGTQLGYATAY